MNRPLRGFFILNLRGPIVATATSECHNSYPHKLLAAELRYTARSDSRRFGWFGGFSGGRVFHDLCNRPFSEIMVRDQDEVLPCPWHGKTLGRLSGGKSLSEIFLGENFAALRRNTLKREGDPDCARCPIKTLHLPASANN